MLSLAAKAWWDTRWAVFGWSVGLSALALMMMAIFPSLQGNQALTDYYESLPQALRDSFGADRPINTLEGYLDAELLSYGPILLGIYGLLHAVKALAGEQQEGHFDFLLAQPVWRWQVVVSRAAIGATGVLALAMATAIGLIVGAWVFGV